MSIYVIGDVQGCYHELQQLIDKIAFDPAADKLWFTGDLVNRGSGSLQTLRFVKSLGESAVTVLGNHDIHLLALYCGVRPTGKDPTLEPILNAEDADELICWLAHQPMLHRDEKHLMVHAGLHRDWSVNFAASLAKEIETELRKVSATKPPGEVLGEAPGEPQTCSRESLYPVIKSLYGPTTGTWAQNEATTDRLRYAVNCFTRMRFCESNGTPDFKHSGPPGSQPQSLVPWFELQNESQKSYTCLTGHWAAMGLKFHDNLCALDTGCVWGNDLTAMRLSDKQLTQVQCTAYSK